jgi:3-methylcrotonyl-CoA carboxylase alpha subunit
VIEDEQLAVSARAAGSADPWSPWQENHAWRLNGDGYQDFAFREGEALLPVRAHLRPGGSFRADLPDGSVEIAGDIDAGIVVVDGVRHKARAIRMQAAIAVLSGGAQHVLTLVDPLAPSAAAAIGGGRLVAPMPGRVTQVLVSAGAAVARGAPLLMLEAMKMEHTITAPADGMIEEVRYRPGDLVEEGVELVVFAASAP